MAGTGDRVWAPEVGVQTTNEPAMVEEIVPPPPVPVEQASPAMQPSAPAPQEVPQGFDDIQRAAAANLRADTSQAAWSQYHGAVAVTGPMSYPHGTEWTCYCRQRVRK